MDFRLERFVRSRWLMLVAGIWSQCTTGSTYVFGLYSEGLKRGLGYDQKQLDTVGFFKDLGANVGVHTGLLYLVVPPWAIVAIGAAHNLFGYLMMWLAATHRISHVELWHMCLLMFLAANAQTYFNTAVVVTSVRNFPTTRGTVIGLMKGFLGLSGAILTFIFRSIYGTDQVSYILFASLLPTLVSLLLMFLIRPLPVVDDPLENTSLYQLSAIALLLALCLMSTTIVNSIAPMGKTLTAIACTVVVVVLAAPIAVAVKTELQKSGIEVQESKRLMGECSESGREKLETGASSKSKVVKDGEALEVQRGQDFTLMQAFMAADFWLLVLAMACGMGSGLTAIDNVNQLGLSLGYSQHDISTFVSLLSIFNFLGRFGAGILSDILLHSKGTPRPAFIVITLGIMAIGHLIIASSFPGALYVGTVVVGICYGAQWSLMPATVSEVFGLKHFSTLFNTISIASPLGSYILSVKVAGYIYDREAEKQHHRHNELLYELLDAALEKTKNMSCSGLACFRLTFLILAGVCLFGCISTMLLVVRTRSYYKEVYQKRYQRQRRKGGASI